MSFDDYIKSLNKEQREELLRTLQSDDAPKPTKKKEKSRPSSIVNDDFTVVRDKPSTSRRPVKFNKNVWLDEGDDKDVKTPPIKGGKTKRNRESAGKIEIECSACGNSFYEYESLVYGDFPKCASCIQRGNR